MKTLLSLIFLFGAYTAQADSTKPANQEQINSFCKSVDQHLKSTRSGKLESDLCKVNEKVVIDQGDAIGRIIVGKVVVKEENTYSIYHCRWNVIPSLEYLMTHSGPDIECELD